MASPYRAPGSSDAGRSLISRLVLVVALIGGALLLFSSCTARVDAGHVGIRVKLAGSSRGVAALRAAYARDFRRGGFVDAVAASGL